MTHRVSFVIPVRNDAVRLRRCLARIRANHAPNVEIELVVADNGSADGSQAVAASAGARVLDLPGLCVSELRNRAAAIASGEFVAFVDADHEIGDGWVQAALDVFVDPAIGGAGALYVSPAGSWVQRMYGILRGGTRGRHDVGWLGSGNLIVRRETFASIGGFDASLETCEDVDFCQRLTASGWRLVADERLRSIHLGDPSTLAALFRGERWRGRDNVRVTFRGSLSLRDLPSVLIPIVQALGLVALVSGAIAIPFVGRRATAVIAVSLAVIVGLSVLRTARMAATGGVRWPRALGQAFLVALTYDLARAVALLGRAPHHRRPVADAPPTIA